MPVSYKTSWGVVMKLLKFVLEGSGPIVWPIAVDQDLVGREEVAQCDGDGILNLGGEYSCIVFEYVDEVPEGTLEHEGLFESVFPSDDDPRPYAGEIVVLGVTSPDDETGLHYPNGFVDHGSVRNYRGNDYRYEVKCTKGTRLRIEASNPIVLPIDAVWSTPLKESDGNIGYLTTSKAAGDTNMIIEFTPQTDGNFFLSQDLVNEELSDYWFKFLGVRVKVNKA